MRWRGTFRNEFQSTFKQIIRSFRPLALWTFEAIRLIFVLTMFQSKRKVQEQMARGTMPIDFHLIATEMQKWAFKCFGIAVSVITILLISFERPWIACFGHFVVIWWIYCQ
ncbi:hypothetical protein M3Y95_00851400 [Aphelenchoides besseyi]|nr:hypothetical protein M3Y95_00851400 [Aphelenchoides besseyi]